jgi:hypothetical protein
MRRARRAPLFLAGSALLLAACDDASSPSSDPLASLLVVPPPTGYTQSDASGHLDLESAAASTPADPARLSRELSGDGFDHGWAQVWVKGGNFITYEVLRLRGAAQTSRVVALERSALQGAQGYVVTALQAVPGSVEYTMFGTTRSGGHDVFCQGVWFAVSRDVYGVTTCSPLPAGAAVVEQLATAQYGVASQAAIR